MKVRAIITTRLNRKGAFAILAGNRVIAVAFGTGRLRRLDDKRYELAIPRVKPPPSDVGVAFWIDEIEPTLL